MQPADDQYKPNPIPDSCPLGCGIKIRKQPNGHLSPTCVLLSDTLPFAIRSSMKTIILSILLSVTSQFFSFQDLKAQITKEVLQKLDSTSVIKVSITGGGVYEGLFFRQTSERLVLNIPGTGLKSFLHSDIKTIDFTGSGLIGPDNHFMPVINPGRNVKVNLVDGSVLVGQLTSQTVKEVVLSNPVTGKMTIAMDQILSVTSQGGRLLAGEYKWLPNPNPTRYLFSPSAFNLKKGEGYYQNVYVDFNLISFGVTDWFSMG